MKLECIVTSERPEEFTGKRGLVRQIVLSLLDNDETHSLVNTFDYVLSEEDVKLHAGKLKGKIVSIGITNFENAFGGRLRARGKLLEVK